MKLEIEDGIVVYLNNHYLKSININDREEIKTIVKKVIDKYNLKLKGILEIIIYIDKKYGAILEIKKEDLDYIDCFELDIEIDIKIIESTFLFKLDDYAIIENLTNSILFTYKGEIYLELNSESDIVLDKIIENSKKIIYGIKAEEIKRKSEVII